MYRRCALRSHRALPTTYFQILAYFPKKNCTLSLIYSTSGQAKLDVLDGSFFSFA